MIFVHIQKKLSNTLVLLYITLHLAIAINQCQMVYIQKNINQCLLVNIFTGDITWLSLNLLIWFSFIYLQYFSFADIYYGQNWRYWASSPSLVSVVLIYKCKVLYSLILRGSLSLPRGSESERPQTVWESGLKIISQSFFLGLKENQDTKQTKRPKLMCLWGHG